MLSVYCKGHGIYGDDVGGDDDDGDGFLFVWAGNFMAMRPDPVGRLMVKDTRHTHTHYTYMPWLTGLLTTLHRGAFLFGRLENDVEGRFLS